MEFTPASSLVVGETIVVVVAAMVTDLRWRRIPNWITFPAMGLGMVQHVVLSGSAGAGTAALGIVLTPLVLLMLRGFRPLGMGDVKLAAAIGSLLGPATGALAMLLAALAGGFVAIAWCLRPGSEAGSSIAPFLAGVPVLGKMWSRTDSEGEPVAAVTVPYGLAIGTGALAALGVVKWI